MAVLLDFRFVAVLDREAVIGVLWEVGSTELTGEVEEAVILDLGVRVMVVGDVQRRVS